MAERLELVHRGLGEMQRLASDVGSHTRTGRPVSAHLIVPRSINRPSSSISEILGLA